MSHLLAQNLNYGRPVRLTDDIYWVGFADRARGLCCNPYLIIDEGEGILIDAGSRPEFSEVMMKVLQTGLAPNQISTLIYHHYDPDLCGSVANFEALIARPDLKIISKHENNVFIRYYGVRSKLLCIDELDRTLVLNSGRTLRFIPTPYAHSAGSFMTLDEHSGTLFTSDLLGSFDPRGERDLFKELHEACHSCRRTLPAIDELCEGTNAPCPLSEMVAFHRVEMPSDRALHLACKRVLAAGAKLVAPQHGSLWHRPDDVECIVRRLASLDKVGIDGVADPREP